ncbi:flagellar brake protein, partial [Candidatus Desantisbacteria bacterium]|nr:flagellar brake protein [Candidatus Desantisbacteria bacterium]
MLVEIPINKQLIIETDIPEYPGKYLSRVEDINDEYIYIAVPISKQNLVPIRIGTNLNIAYMEGQKSYSFQSKVIDRKSVPIPVLVILRPSQFEIRERRKFTRYYVEIPIFIKITSPNAPEIVGVKDGFKAVTKNFSMGGLLFETHFPLPIGLILQIEINLPAYNTPVIMLGKIIQIMELDIKNVYGIGVRFFMIEEKKRDEIVRFIF